MPGGENRALDHQHVGPGLLYDLGALRGLRRHCRDRAEDARVFDRLDSVGDEPRLHRLAVDLLQERVDARLVCRGDLLDHRPGVFVPGMHPIEVEDRHAAKLSHRDNGEIVRADVINSCTQTAFSERAELGE